MDVMQHPVGAMILESLTRNNSTLSDDHFSVLKHTRRYMTYGNQTQDLSELEQSIKKAEEIR